MQQLDLLQQSAASVCLGTKEGPTPALPAPSSSSSSSSSSRIGVSPRIIIPVTDLLSLTNFSFYSHPLISQPCAALPALEAAIAEEWRNRGALGPPPRVGVSGWLGKDHVTPRGLCSSKLNGLVCVEGVVNRCSAVTPKLQRAVYVTEDAQQQQQQAAAAAAADREVHLRNFYDATDLDKDIRDAQPPPERDPEGRKVNRQELGYSQYQNHQKFYVQETPETSPTGQLPRWVEVAAEGDLCDAAKCGDRVRVFGVYRPRAALQGAQTSGFVRPILVANHIQVLSAAARASMLQSVPADIANMRAFASRKDLLQVLSHSFSPAVCGHETVKSGLILSLAGGSERQTASFHRIRGDIHVLLIGDPSAGKSQLLRFALGIVPGSVSSTGRGSSGVGLTAAVVTDADTGERRVEGGAAVLADKSLICIDEFDKMKQTDRVAIHEVMEQQTVSVAKAGIYTTLNARCTVLAAANPLYGCWSSEIPLRAQLAFEESLLTRFDLIFILRDSLTSEEDERLAEAVLRNVTENATPAGAGGGTERRQLGDGSVQPEGDMQKQIRGQFRDTQTQEETEPTRAFYHRNEMLYYDKSGREHECLTHEFLRKYLAVVRSGCLLEDDQQPQQQQQQQGPQLSDDAAAALIEFYGEIRQRAQQQKRDSRTADTQSVSLVQAVTVRTLEASLRLATAHAKLKLKKWITPEDVRVAQRMLLYTLFGESFEETEGDGRESETETETETEEETDMETPLRRTTAADRAARRQAREQRQAEAKRRRGGKALEAEDTAMASQLEGLGIDPQKRRRRQTVSDEEGQTEAVQALHSQGLRGDILHSLILNTLKEVDEGSGVTEEALLKAVCARASSKGLPVPSAAELTAALNELNSKDSAPILVHDGLIYEC